METLRIAVMGFYGFQNCGDEAILLSIIDSLGHNHEYIVCTSLPFNMFQQYHIKLPECVEEVRQINDIRTDYDAYLLGGGQLNWGFGWTQVFNAVSEGKPCMNYGVGYYVDTYPRYHPKLNKTYKEFLSLFNAVTVRDLHSQKLLREIGVNPTLTMCPAVNLKEEQFNSPENMIIAVPRYEDVTKFEENQPQIEWFIQRLKDEPKEGILLVPFAPHDVEGKPLGMMVCREISRRLEGVTTLQLDDPRRMKYLISRSKRVISANRYHALVWAAAHNIPYEVCPQTAVHMSKIDAFLEMHKKYGDKLKEMETENREVFYKIMEGK